MHENTLVADYNLLGIFYGIELRHQGKILSPQLIQKSSKMTLALTNIFECVENVVYLALEHNSFIMAFFLIEAFTLLQNKCSVMLSLLKWHIKGGKALCSIIFYINDILTSILSLHVHATITMNAFESRMVTQYLFQVLT